MVIVCRWTGSSDRLKRPLIKLCASMGSARDHKRGHRGRRKHDCRGSRSQERRGIHIKRCRQCRHWDEGRRPRKNNNTGRCASQSPLRRSARKRSARRNNSPAVHALAHVHADWKRRREVYGSRRGKQSEWKDLLPGRHFREARKQSQHAQVSLAQCVQGPGSHYRC